VAVAAGSAGIARSSVSRSQLLPDSFASMKTTVPRNMPEYCALLLPRTRISSVATGTAQQFHLAPSHISSLLTVQDGRAPLACGTRWVGPYLAQWPTVDTKTGLEAIISSCARDFSWFAPFDSCS
jgi:hypothetical protein